MKNPSWSEVSKLKDRAELWTTRAMKAEAKGDYNRAGDLRTKAIKISAQANDLIQKLIGI